MMAGHCKKPRIPDILPVRAVIIRVQIKPVRHPYFLPDLFVKEEAPHFGMANRILTVACMTPQFLHQIGLEILEPVRKFSEIVKCEKKGYYSDE